MTQRKKYIILFNEFILIPPDKVEFSVWIWVYTFKINIYDFKCNNI